MAAILMDVFNVKTSSSSEQTLPDMLKLIHDSRLIDGANVKTSSSSEQISRESTHRHDSHLIDGASVKNSSTSRRE